MGNGFSERVCVELAFQGEFGWLRNHFWTNFRSQMASVSLSGGRRFAVKTRLGSVTRFKLDLGFALEEENHFETDLGAFWD